MSNKKEEKVIYGLSQLHLAPEAEGFTKDEPKYETPFPVLGAVGFSPEPEQDIAKLFADDKTFYTVSQTSSYTGDLIVVRFPDQVHTDILGNIKLSGGGILDVDGSITKNFALMAEAKTDQGRIRFIYYLATGGKPVREYNTLEDGAPEIPTETMNLSMSSIKLKIGESSSKEGQYVFMYKVREDDPAFETFFDAVPLPVIPTPVPPVIPEA